MPTLTSQELSDLESIKNDVIAETKDVEDYYDYLSQKGFAYADLALGVINNTGVFGQVAVSYADVYAGNYSNIDLSYNSTDFQTLMKNIMEADYQERVDELGGELEWDDVRDAHRTAIDALNDGKSLSGTDRLPYEAWTAETILNVSDDATDTWSDMISDTSSDWLPDSFDELVLGGSIMLSTVKNIFYMEDGASKNAAVTWVESAFSNQVWNTLDPYIVNNLVVTNQISSAAAYHVARNIPVVYNSIVSYFSESKSVFNYDPIQSPLVFDLDGDGIEVTALVGSTVMFDIDNDGFRENTAWINGDDGLLILDENSNGIVDNQSELFGGVDDDGFTELTLLDSNSDGYIDSSDSAYSDLKIWQDANEDGISQSSELQGLSYWGIDSIDLANVTQPPSEYINGNWISHRSTYDKSGGGTGEVADVWFEYDNMNSRYGLDYDLDVRTLFMPAARGYGNVADLHIAMSEDETLLDMVKDATEMDISDMGALIEHSKEILIRWAGTQDVVQGSFPESTGMDNRLIRAIEKFIADDAGNASGPFAGYDISERSVHLVANRFVQELVTRIVINNQLAAETGSLTYDLASDTFSGSVDFQDLIDLIETEAPSDVRENAAYWRQMTAMLDNIAGDLSVATSTFETYLQTAIDNSGSVFSISDFRDMAVITKTASIPNPGNNAWDVFGYDNRSVDNTSVDGKMYYMAARYWGDSSNTTDDVIIGFNSGTQYTTSWDVTGRDGVNVESFGGNDTIYGWYAGDILRGGDGHDTIYGFEGIDNIDGGDGNDIIYGGDDDDELNGDFGDDIIYGDAGSDLIRGYRDNDTIYGGEGDDFLYAESDSGHSSTYTEEIRGGNGNDLIHGADGVDTLYGDAGNDTIYGFDGNDTIYGGDGNDIIDAGAGQNTIYGGDGNDTLIATASFYYSGTINYYDGGAGDDVITIHEPTIPTEATLYATVVDASGTDDLVIDLITSSTTFSMEQSGDDLLIYADRHLITVQDQFAIQDEYAIDNVRVTFNGETEETVFDMSAWTPVSGDNYQGTAAVDTYSGSAYSDIAYGYAGNDTLNGFNGNDTLYGGDGNDTLRGFNQNDTLYGEDGNDSLLGGYGDDILIGGAGNDSLSGDQGANTFVINYGEGRDTISANASIDLNTIDLGGISLSDFSFQAIYSGSSIDKIRVHYGLDDNNYFEIFGLDDDSMLYQIEFDDSSTYHLNNNMTFTNGTGGNDTINGTSEVDIVNSFGGTDTINTGLGADYIRATGDATVYSGYGNDYVELFGGDDFVDASSGDDYVLLGTGNDTVVHSLGNNIGASDFYSGQWDTDTLRITAANESELTDTVRDEILEVKQHINTYDLPQYGSISPNFTASNLGFEIDASFEALELYVDGVLTSTDANAANDDFVVGANQYFYGNVLWDNGNGLDSTFGTLIGVTSVSSVATTQGGSITINSDGSIHYIAPTSYTGTDTYTYTLDDGFGGTDTGTLSFDLSSTTISGTASGETVNGTNGANVLDGLAGNDTLQGYNGDDVIYGGDGNDYIRAGNDNDIIFGGDGNDSLYGDAGNDFIYGEDGDDTYVAKGGDTYFDGGAGFNTANYTILGFSGGITANLETGIVTKDDGSTDTLVNVERLLGTSSNDNITGGDLGETIEGRQGNDTIYGGGGNDYLYGNEGDDYIDGQGGLDTIKGGDGNDTIHGGVDNDSLWGEAGNDTLYGYDGNDTLVGSLGNDVFDGGSGINIANYSVLGGSVTVDMDASSNQVTKYDSSYDDLTDVQVVYGSNYNDTISGGFNMNLQGRGGNDTITGGTGADFIYGDDGDDILHGGVGTDRLYGGAGDDTFIFNRGEGTDTIVNDDSTSTGDVVDFGVSGTAIDHDQLWFEQSGNHLLVSVIGTNDTMTLENWYTTGYTVDEFESTNGYTLSAADVATLVTAMASETKPSFGQTDMPTQTQTNLDPTLASVWAA